MPKIIYCHRCAKEITVANSSVFVQQRDGSSVTLRFCSECNALVEEAIKPIAEPRYPPRGYKVLSSKDKELILDSLIDNDGDIRKVSIATNIPYSSVYNFCKKIKESYKVIDVKQEICSLDLGKVWACHDARWSVKKIADEMSCSVEAISRVLSSPRPIMNVDTFLR